MTSLPKTADPLTHPLVAQILQLAENNCNLYLIGGYVRDALLSGRSPSGSHKDFDFMVMRASAVEFARRVSDKLNGHFVMLDQENDTARVVTDTGDCFDFAGCVGGTLESDIRRRDFTVNAIAWDPLDSENLIDLVGGVDDLEKKSLRVISEKSYIEDPLRLLRSYRFAALLGFDIDETTNTYIRKHAKSITKVAAERICAELFLMLETNASGKQIKIMGENGLLEAIFPELQDQRRVTSNAYHHLGLFDHSVETLVQAELALEEMPDWAKQLMNEELASGISRRAATKLAGLLHDIGKPDTWVINEQGKHTFIGHDKLGAQMCLPLAKRLKWSKPLERFVEKLVRWHLRPGQLFQQGEPTDKAKYRFYKTIGEELPELIVLALADFRSTCGPGLQDGRREAEQNLLELLRNFSVYQVGQKKETRFLDGTELMELLGIGPGPVIGDMLEDILEAQALGEVKTYAEAASLAQKLYKEKYCR